jgi:hypothetical protein
MWCVVSGYEPKPKCPRRLSEIRDVKASFTDGGSVELNVTLTYDPWCCSGGHEIADAIAALNNALEHAQECESAWIAQAVEAD